MLRINFFCSEIVVSLEMPIGFELQGTN
ncbi:MAG: hypothetical protein RIQ33_1607, partial [Bacteroidota bacterium]